MITFALAIYNLVRLRISRRRRHEQGVTGHDLAPRRPARANEPQARNRIIASPHLAEDAFARFSPGFSAFC
jgi:hypothetical protein